MSVNAYHCADMPERRAEELNDLLHYQSIFRLLDLLNKRTANRLNKRINSKPLKLLQLADPRKRNAENLMVLLHAQSIRRRLNSYNFDARLDYGKTTSSKNHKQTL